VGEKSRYFKASKNSNMLRVALPLSANVPNVLRCVAFLGAFVHSTYLQSYKFDVQLPRFSNFMLAEKAE